MPSAITTQDEPSSIPSIDISPFLKDPHSEAAKAVVSEVRAACKSTGFFLITGHGHSKELQKEAFDAAARFFALPFPDKQKLDVKKNVGFRGYDVLETETFSSGNKPDLKEGYFIGTDIPLSDPQVGRFFMGPNVWPSEAQLASSSFMQPCMKYYDALLDLTQRILELVAFTLPYGPDIFNKFVADRPVAPLRLLHYPPAKPAEEKKQFGASAHTDYGAITLLLQDGNPGLEVLDHRTDTWINVDPNPDAYVVNVGDMLSLWTNNDYKSSMHRVINKKPVDRYSIAFFFDGNLDCPLDPLDGSPRSDLSTPATVETHLIQRLQASYAG